MSKINLRLLIGIALILQVFNYLGMRTIQWVWMSQNNYANEYVPYLGLGYQSLSNFIYILLPDVLPIIVLSLALVLATRYKTIIFLLLLSIMAKLFVPLYDFQQNIRNDLSFDYSFTKSFRYALIGYSDFTFILDILSMFVTLGSLLALVLLALPTMQRMKNEKIRKKG
jgi:hypothetical protein